MSNGNGSGGGWGKGGGSGKGMGRGKGRGRGRGMGNGRGRVRARARDSMACPPVHDAGPMQAVRRPDPEVEKLKAQAAAMLARLQAVRERIARMGEGTGSAGNLPVPGIKEPAPGESRRKLAVIDRERCAICGLCVDLCPTGAIHMGDVIMIDPGRCMGCGSCVEECPNGAISLAGRRKQGGGAPASGS
jgi:NAD-dependent dihydropyrimidine dehydrogenase PreA subunit